MLHELTQTVAAVFGPPNLELRRRLHALERRLAASERRYWQLVDAAAEAILVADRSGRLIEANEAACALLGYSRGELLRLQAESLLAGADGDGSEVDALRGGATVTGVRRLRRSDGTLVEVEGSVKILPDGRFQAILRDVGERRRMEEALRESERRLRRLTASARAVVYRFCPSPERRGGGFTPPGAPPPPPPPPGGHNAPRPVLG